MTNDIIDWHSGLQDFFSFLDGLNLHLTGTLTFPSRFRRSMIRLCEITTYDDYECCNPQRRQLISFLHGYTSMYVASL